MTKLLGTALLVQGVFWRAAGFRAQKNWDQNSGIVPTEYCAFSYGKPVAELAMNLVPTGAAGCNQALQFLQLCGRWCDAVLLQQLVPQHIGLALCAEALQQLNLRRIAHHL